LNGWATDYSSIESTNSSTIGQPIGNNGRVVKNTRTFHSRTVQFNKLCTEDWRSERLLYGYGYDCC